MKVTDVLICDNSAVADAIGRGNHDLLARRPPLRQTVQISSGVSIGRLDSDLFEAVARACGPPGYNHDPVRLYTQLYAFSREPAPESASYNWDPDRRLQVCVALSRLIHPTNAAFFWSARVLHDDQGNLHRIIPGPVSSFGCEAFIVHDAGNWLTQNDVLALTSLISAYDAAQLPPSVRRAFWHFEFASRVWDISIRWTLLATAIEALVHTDRKSSTKQFVVRLQGLCSDVGGASISKQEAEDIYDKRSSLVHGAGLSALTSADRSLYLKMEAVLRAAIQRSLSDPTFRQLLGDPDQIRRKWPV